MKKDLRIRIMTTLMAGTFAFGFMAGPLSSFRPDLNTVHAYAAEASTEKKTEKPTEKPTEKKTEKPTEPPSSEDPGGGTEPPATDPEPEPPADPEVPQPDTPGGE